MLRIYQLGTFQKCKLGLYDERHEYYGIHLKKQLKRRVLNEEMVGRFAIRH